MRWVVVTLLALATIARAETFTGILGERAITQPVGEAMARSIARSLPVLSASPGVTFTFDKATHVFVRQTEILGQLYLEQAQPLGRGNINLNVSYQWVRLATVDGRDLNDLSDPGPPILSRSDQPAFRVPHFGLDLTTSEVTLNATYGVTDTLDVNLTLPLLVSDFGVNAVARAITGQTQPDHADASHFGAGDLFLRAKQRLVRGRFGTLAAGLVVRAPSGNPDYFQGTGEWAVTPLLYASTPAVPLSTDVYLQGHFNGGVELDAGDVDQSAGRIGLGVDLGLRNRATLGISFLASEPFAGIAPPGFFDVSRVDIHTGQLTTGPILGLSRSRAPTYDLAVGGRVKLWRDTVIGFASVIIPLNEAGFRAGAIPLIGIEAAF